MEQEDFLIRLHAYFGSVDDVKFMSFCHILFKYEPLPEHIVNVFQDPVRLLTEYNLYLIDKATSSELIAYQNRLVRFYFSQNISSVYGVSTKYFMHHVFSEIRPSTHEFQRLQNELITEKLLSVYHNGVNLHNSLMATLIDSAVVDKLGMYTYLSRVSMRQVGYTFIRVALRLVVRQGYSESEYFALTDKIWAQNADTRVITTIGKSLIEYGEVNRACFRPIREWIETKIEEEDSIITPKMGCLLKSISDEMSYRKCILSNDIEAIIIKCMFAPRAIPPIVVSDMCELIFSMNEKVRDFYKHKLRLLVMNRVEADARATEYTTTDEGVASLGLCFQDKGDLNPYAKEMKDTFGITTYADYAKNDLKYLDLFIALTEPRYKEVQNRTRKVNNLLVTY